MLPKPFRAEAVFSCFAKLLNVEFDYRDEETAKTDSPGTKESIDISKIKLPQKLLSRITKAAELYEITELEDTLVDIEKLGPEASGLTDYIKDAISSYNMESIMNLFDKSNDATLK